MRATVLLMLTTLAPLPLAAEDAPPAEGAEILSAIARLSAATAPGGGGPDAYAAVLHDRFSRWTSGEKRVFDKRAWVDGVREWFDEGWRVSDREQEIVELTVDGERAHTRRVVTETYRGPDGETSTARAAVSETWVRGADGWLLLRVDATTLDAP